MNTRSGSWWEASLPRQRRALKPSLARIHEQGDLLNQINVILPDGQITSDFPNSRQAPFAKIFPFAADPNQLHDLAVPSRKRGVAHVINAGRDAVDAAASGDVRGWQGGSTRIIGSSAMPLQARLWLAHPMHHRRSVCLARRLHRSYAVRREGLTTTARSSSRLARELSG
jgi:hypothetical protein